MKIEKLKQESQQRTKDFENDLKELAIRQDKQQKDLDYNALLYDGKY